MKCLCTFYVPDGNHISYQTIGRKEKPWNVLQPEETSLLFKTKMKHFDAIMKDVGPIIYPPQRQVQKSPKARSGISPISTESISRAAESRQVRYQTNQSGRPVGSFHSQRGTAQNSLAQNVPKGRTGRPWMPDACAIVVFNNLDTFFFEISKK